MNPTILTVGGTYFDFMQPEQCAIDIQTIAHALSHICRFTGHTSSFYSVAQHSVLVSQLVPPEHAMAGLLHDAAEAYLGDVASPLKQLLPEYKAIEKRVEAHVLACFGLPATLPPEVKQADLLALAIEQRDLMPCHDDVWECEHTPGFYRGVASDLINPLTPYEARMEFLKRFEDLLLLGLEKYLNSDAGKTANRVTDWSAA